MIDTLRYRRKRKNDAREFVMNLLFGAAFWGCMAGAVAERMGYLQGGLFKMLFMALLWIVIASVVLMTGFLAFVGYKHLRANWNNRAELNKAGGAIMTALKKMSAWSLSIFGLILAICFYVGLPLLGVLVFGSTVSMLLGVVILCQISNWRAAKI